MKHMVVQRPAVAVAGVTDSHLDWPGTHPGIGKAHFGGHLGRGHWGVVLGPSPFLSCTLRSCSASGCHEPSRLGLNPKTLSQNKPLPLYSWVLGKVSRTREADHPVTVGEDKEVPVQCSVVKAELCLPWLWWLSHRSMHVTTKCRTPHTVMPVAISCVYIRCDYVRRKHWRELGKSHKRPLRTTFAICLYL